LNQHYFAGTGRRKTAVARVRLYPGGGSIVINGKPMDEIFNRPAHQSLVLKPFLVSAQSDKFNAQIKVEGGGISAWAGAIAHGIARALLVMDVGLKKPLRDNGLLTRDARVKERKKYGLKRARKAPQYTKR
jgi:small subunit ribosomal protein S9